MFVCVMCDVTVRTIGTTTVLYIQTTENSTGSKTGNSEWNWERTLNCATDFLTTSECSNF